MKIGHAGHCNTAIRLLQRLAHLHRTSLRLCPLFFNDKLIRRGEGPEQAGRQVDTLLAPVAIPVSTPVT